MERSGVGALAAEEIPAFAARYGEAAGGRRIKGRLLHPGPPDEAVGERWPWPLR